jgi:hypothetical protein
MNQHLLLLSPLVQSVQASFVLAAASQITGLSAPEYCCISLVDVPTALAVPWRPRFAASQVLLPVY